MDSRRALPLLPINIFPYLLYFKVLSVVFMNY